MVYNAIRKDTLTLVLTEYTVNSCSFTNTTAYKCNGLVEVSTRFSVDTALGISQGRQILTVYGAVAPTGSHMIIAMYDSKPLMCWISGQSIFLRNDAELPSGAVVYITGTYPCT